MEQFKFKKKFGQNFLKDDSIIRKIVDKAVITNKDLVIEVGPGKGILTKHLSLKAKNVLSYEIDTELELILNEINKEYKNANFIFEDFLKRNIKTDVEKYNYEKLYFISNVPYYITTPILMKLMESGLKFEKIIMMVQKEVGDRFSAKPGSKDYGSLTVFLNYYYSVKKEFDVNRTYFTPQPNVDSVVVSFTSKEELLPLKNKDLFFKLVKDSFRYKRKTIKNNLSEYNLKKIEEVLQKHSYTLSVRAEMLPVNIFVDISNNLE